MLKYVNDCFHQTTIFGLDSFKIIAFYTFLMDFLKYIWDLRKFIQMMLNYVSSLMEIFLLLQVY